MLMQKQCLASKVSAARPSCARASPVVCKASKGEPSSSQGSSVAVAARGQLACKQGGPAQGDVCGG
eukprot:1153225-Pelagomonas_calceolata.AAC.5